MVFGRSRHKPSGHWVQFTGLFNVAGVQFRRAEASTFVSLVRRAERKGWTYGLGLEPEPDDIHDPCAIKVYGISQWKGLFGPLRTERAWIGYLPRDEATSVHRELVAKDLPFEAELYSIYVSARGFIDIKMLVLGPGGTSASARTRREKRASAENINAPDRF